MIQVKSKLPKEWFINTCVNECYKSEHLYDTYKRFNLIYSKYENTYLKKVINK